MIPDTKEFFINVMDHETWGSSMTVWGSLADPESMEVVESLLQLPYREVKHPTYGTVMRMLEHQVPFLPLAEVPRAGSSGGGMGEVWVDIANEEEVGRGRGDDVGVGV